MWRFQIPVLMEAGFRGVAPDMRGYELSEKPPRVRDSHGELLARRDAPDRGPPCGERCDRRSRLGSCGGVAGGDAPPGDNREASDPERTPPGTLSARPTEAQAATQELEYVCPASYRTAGTLCRAYDLARFLRDIRRDPSRSAAFTEKHVERYREAMARPGALTAACNYYRHSFARTPSRRGRSQGR